jgi:hypothetical protein
MLPKLTKESSPWGSCHGIGVMLVWETSPWGSWLLRSWCWAAAVEEESKTFFCSCSAGSSAEGKSSFSPESWPADQWQDQLTDRHIASQSELRIT